MKMKRCLLSFATLIVVMCCTTVSLSSCGDDDDNGGAFGSTEFDGSSIVGKWGLSKVQIISEGETFEMGVSKNANKDEWDYETYTLAEDGRFEYESWVNGVVDSPVTGTYSYSKDSKQLNITNLGVPTVTVQSLTSKTLIIRYSEDGDTYIMIYNRIGEGIIDGGGVTPEPDPDPDPTPGPSGVKKTDYTGSFGDYTATSVVGTWKQTWDYEKYIQNGITTNETGVASTESSIVMKSDGTYTITTQGESPISGTYTYDSATKKLRFNFTNEDGSQVMEGKVEVLTDYYCVLSMTETYDNEKYELIQTFKRQ